MPTKEWMRKRQMLTFWLLKEEAEAFRRACEKENKRPTTVLRDTVQAMMEKVDAA